LVRSFGSVAEDYLGNDAVSKENENENTKELRERVTKIVPYAAPKKIRLSLDGFLLRDMMIDKSAMLCVREKSYSFLVCVSIRC
jgi:hypothetical protein